MNDIKLDNFPWFDGTTAILNQAMQSERMPHALLLAAPAGSGKTIYAAAIAQSLLCANHQVLAKTCGQCKSCHLFAAQNHPDYYLVDFLLDNKGTQKKSIGIDQIRKLNEKLQDTSQLQGWRVAVISSVSAMTTASFNALLKTLEEPGDRTLLILLTDNLQNVPATVRSRCQLLLAELKDDKLLNWLKERSGKSSEAVKLALNYNQSAPLATLEYLQNDGVALQKQLFKLLDSILLNQTTPGEFLNQQESPLELLVDKLAYYFHQVQLARINADKETIYQSLPIKLPFQLYQKIIDFRRAQDAGSNLQVKLQIEAILIQWFEIGRKIGHYSNA